MTGMDDSDPAVDDAWEDDGAAPQPDTEAEPQLQPLDLLVWDAPNIDMTLSNVIGARPSPASRPRFDAVARWLVDGAGDRDVEGSVFTNVPPGAATGMRGWIEALRSFGYAVFAKPKLHHDDDVDLAMLEHIDERSRTHRLTRLVVASGDGRNFTGPLEAIARTGTEVVVLSFGEVAGYALAYPIDREGYGRLSRLLSMGKMRCAKGECDLTLSEVAGYAMESDLLTFVDLEDVPGAFTTPLDRVRLDALPAQGAWLRPTRSMREVAANTSGH